MSHTATSRRLFRQFAAIAAAGAMLVACGSESADESAAVTAAEVSAETPTFGLVSPSEAATLATDPDVTVLDVRTPEEFADGHLENALLVDFYDATFADQLAELDPDGTYVLYCRSGNRSGQAAALMADLGFEQVYDVAGGVIEWQRQGQPLVR